MMDRNSIIGLLLITAIIIGYMIYAQPSAEEKARMKKQQDSIALVQKDAEAKKLAEQQKQQEEAAALPKDSNGVVSDSARAAFQAKQYGIFAKAAEGKASSITLENEVMKVKVSTLGGRIESVELKNYKTYYGKPLMLFNPDSSAQAINFRAGDKTVSTDAFFFTPQGQGFSVAGDATKQLAMRLTTNDPNKYIEFVYSLKGNDYMMGYTINMVGMNDVVAGNQTALAMRVAIAAPTHEKAIKNERETSTIYYKYNEKDVDNMSERADDKKVFTDGALKWVSFKQQFFTSVFIAESNFANSSLAVTRTPHGSKNYVRDFGAKLYIPYSHKPSESFAMKIYYGPAHYGTLKQYEGLHLEKQVRLGWGIFGWVNRFLVIPVFNWLNSFNMNFGVIILILTLIIKILLFPVAYKMYISSAKMRVLKPEIEEINKKYEGGDPMKKQQETMALYKKAGVNPMAGCIPMLLQFPILIALVSFFPSSIEMRGESFLWAEDLSTYDSLIRLPFEIPFLGDHLSLFAILMTISTIIYTWFNSQLMGTSNQMPGMKAMMYVMPVLFLGFLNTRSAGLSYYYLLANLISIGQSLAMQRFVDQDALHRKIEENKKKPVTASKWQQRMEQMMKQQQQRQQGGLDKGKKK